MDKLKQMDQTLNKLFQFTFNETKIYIFSEEDKDGYIYINVADSGVYELIQQKRSKFASIISEFVDVSKVKIRLIKKEIRTIQTENEFTLLKEVIVKEVFKTKRVFIVRKAISNKELIDKIEDFMTNKYEKLLTEQKKIREKDSDYLNSIVYTANYGEIAMIASIHNLLMEYMEKEE